ncbi:MAG: hypothetical protein ACYCV4_05420 [Dermatophilaceae bacterium]
MSASDVIAVLSLAIALLVGLPSWFSFGMNRAAARDARAAKEKAEEQRAVVGEVLRQLKPPNGRTVGQMAEESSRWMEDLSKELERHLAWSRQAVLALSEQGITLPEDPDAYSDDAYKGGRGGTTGRGHRPGTAMPGR